MSAVCLSDSGLVQCVCMCQSQTDISCMYVYSQLRSTAYQFSAVKEIQLAMAVFVFYIAESKAEDEESPRKCRKKGGR